MKIFVLGYWDCDIIIITNLLGILLLQPGVEHILPGLEVQSLDSQGGPQIVTSLNKKMLPLKKNGPP